MSKSSEAVKRWRKKTKERIVESFGGQCCVCGYNRCTSALALHHLDPNEKEMSLGAIRANPKSWKKIVEELRKCVLVCHNCHSEIHSGFIDIPKDVNMFDESFIDYKEESKQTPCVICGKLKPERQITCSYKCAAKNARKVDWDSINLYEEKKTKSFCQIADELECSAAAVRKRYKKLYSGVDRN